MDRTSRWGQIEEIFELAHAQPIEARQQFLAGACGSDGSLRRELEAMLAAAGTDRALAVERLIVDSPSDARDADPWLGTCLGPWRLLDVLGRGGMGTVYRAERADGQYQQEVALKLVRSGPRDPYAIERLRTERQVLAHLRHPNIAGLLDGGFASDGTPYLVMELVDGVPINEWCAAERLSLEAILRLFRVVCDAVHHAHRALIVHRDLKPSNIFVSRSGGVKLLDFGIAKLLDPAASGFDSPVTRAEMQLITPEYAAPEQAGGGQITTATDVYALGVVLYELLTGVRPRECGGTGPVGYAHDTRPPVPAPSDALRRRPRSGAAGSRRFERRVRGDLNRIVLTALRDEPERRYASAGQLGEEIDRFLEGRAVLAQPDTVAYRARTFVRRHRLAVTAAAVLASCITTFGVVAALQARALAEQGRIAGLERDKAEQVVRVLVDLFETTNPAVRPDGDRMPIGQFLAGAEARALAQLGAAPLVRAKLQQVFGLIHAERGEFMPARTALEEALAAQRRLVGPDHPDSLESLQALGLTIRELGDHARAGRLLDESLARHRRVYGDGHDKTARAMVTVAPLVAATDLDAERALLTQALDIRRRVLPPNDPDLAITLGALAGHHQRRGELERSRELFRQALAVFRDSGERRHPASVTLMGDYASLLSGPLKAHDEAEATLREAIAVGEQVLGAGTLTVADLTNDLAVVLAAVGRHAESERAFRDSIDRHVVLFGESHWRVRNVARNLGLVLALQQRYREALPWMDRAVSIHALEHGSDISLEGIRAQRAWVVFVVGRSAEALDAARRAVSAIEGMKDANDGHVLAYSRIVLARILSGTGRPDAAEPAARAAMAWFERWGAGHPQLANAECEVGRAQVLQGRTAEGRAALEHCVPIYRAWGHADPHSVQSLDRLLTDAAPLRASRRGQRQP